MSRRIGFNLQPLASSLLTGIGIYTMEIVRRLPGVLGNEFDCEGQVFDFAGRNHAEERIRSILVPAEGELSDTAVSYPVRTCRLFPLGAYIRAGSFGRIVPYQRLLRSKTDITVFFNYLRPDCVAGKSIITVYDMVSARFPETMDKRNRNLLRKYLAKSCRKADLIITISEFSKKEITACLGISPEKIRVALCGFDSNMYYPAVDSAEKGEIRQKLAEIYQISSPFILYLGTLEPRKNVDVLLDSFAALHSRYPDLKLVIAGGLGWQYGKTLAHLSDLGLGDSIIRTGYIPETDKRMFYASAEVFVFPSIYEGFGLPVLEAMACGTPVVCSNTSSLPEVVGDAGLLCDPGNAQAFADAIERILTDKGLRDGLHARQRDQVTQFTWENAANVYGQSIRDVVKLHK